MKPPVTLIKSALHKQGGLEKYTWQLASDFCALGCPVTVLTTHVQPAEAPFDDPLLNIVSLPIDHGMSVWNLLHFDKSCTAYLKQHPTPVIFSLDRNRFQTHIRAGNGVHAAYLERRVQEEGRLKALSFAFNPLHRAILSLEKRALEHLGLKVLFTNSQMVKEEVLRFYAVPEEKVCVAHNGVEWRGLQHAFDAWEEQKKAGTPFQFLFIGHNFRRKGLDKLLNALSFLKQEHFHLNVVGKDKEMGRFEALIQRLGLSEKVALCGPQKEILPFYQAADCLVVPSLYDPFANVTVEALALGLYVLSSKHNGGHEVLTPDNGFVIEDLHDPFCLVSALKKTLRRPKTKESAQAIRSSVEHLDFSRQLRFITEKTIQGK